MASGLRPFYEIFIWFLLFTFFVTIFVVSFLSLQNPTSDLIVNDNYGFNKSINMLNQQMGNFTTFANTTQTKLGEAKPDPLQFVFLMFESAFYIPQLFLGIISSSIVAMTTLLFNFGGGDLSKNPFVSTTVGLLSMVMYIIFAVLTVRAVLYIIKAVRTGESER